MNPPIMVDKARPVENKKKSESLDKLNAYTRLLLELKQELEFMKIEFYSRVVVKGCHIQSDNSGNLEPPIHSEQMLVGATTTIVEAVEIGGTSTIHNEDIGATTTSKSVEGDGSAEATYFGIEETTAALGTTSGEVATIVGAATTAEALIIAATAISVGLAISVAPAIGDESGRFVEADMSGEVPTTVDPTISTEPEINVEAAQIGEEEEIHNEQKVVDDATFSDDVAIIVETLTFVSQQLGNLEAENTFGPHVCAFEHFVFD